MSHSYASSSTYYLFDSSDIASVYALTRVPSCAIRQGPKVSPIAFGLLPYRFMLSFPGTRQTEIKIIKKIRLFSRIVLHPDSKTIKTFALHPGPAPPTEIFLRKNQLGCAQSQRFCKVA